MIENESNQIDFLNQNLQTDIFKIENNDFNLAFPNSKNHYLKQERQPRQPEIKGKNFIQKNKRCLVAKKQK